MITDCKCLGTFFFLYYSQQTRINFLIVIPNKRFLFHFLNTIFIYLLEIKEYLIKFIIFFQKQKKKESKSGWQIFTVCKNVLVMTQFFLVYGYQRKKKKEKKFYPLFSLGRKSKKKEYCKLPINLYQKMVLVKNYPYKS